MRIAGAASWVHKWLALVIGVQALLWVASGLFFAIYPIERVRSEHRIAEQSYATLDAGVLSSLAETGPLLRSAPTKVSIERDMLGRAVAVVEFGEGRPALLDLETRRVLSPLQESAAIAIARGYVEAAPPVREARLVEEGSTEYRGALPAWRIAFDDAEGLAVYVAADTGRVTARRSDLWRAYDALWALHIMDWRDHENFNNGLLIAASFLALIVIIAGFVLFPYRLSFGRPRKN
jgi:DUF971 family protein